MTTLDEWLAALTEELGCEISPDLIPAVLDLARDAAHAIQRPAAPLSAYVAGYAAGLAQADQRAQAAIVERARVFAEGWPQPGD
ncbi:DUF6457 domain-containing protein [Diaminobutyricibacter sp. McL0608]|uniref:DUF6457 domain-containing protein n=1 Tax=Leifsonia sp. McL0608 TaxID=3143537 RepID=UPI0031F2E206